MKKGTYPSLLTGLLLKKFTEKGLRNHFLDGKLQQWGRPGDWEREADRIYEIRIR